MLGEEFLSSRYNSVSMVACIRYDAQACGEWYLSLWIRYGGFNTACLTGLIKIDVP